MNVAHCPAAMANGSVVERAFQLAGSCTTVDEIRHTLRHEGYAQVDAHLGGPMIRRELKALIDKEKAGKQA